MKYIIFLANFGLIYFFSGSIMPPIGIGCVLIGLIVFLCCYSNNLGQTIINWQLADWTRLWSESDDQRQVLLSVALLSISMKIGTVIALIVEVSTILVVALAILIASGWIIEGKESGMTVAGAGWIAKVVVKIYNFINSLYDKIAELIVKLEFTILGVKLN